MAASTWLRTSSKENRLPGQLANHKSSCCSRSLHAVTPPVHIPRLFLKSVALETCLSRYPLSQGMALEYFKIHLFQYNDKLEYVLL